MCRLLTKLSTVVDRTELNMDTAWAETGDRSVHLDLISARYLIVMAGTC